MSLTYERFAYRVKILRDAQKEFVRSRGDAPNIIAKCIALEKETDTLAGSIMLPASDADEKPSVMTFIKFKLAVETMRYAQKMYFRTRTNDWKKKMHDAEVIIDAVIMNMQFPPEKKASQEKLF